MFTVLERWTAGIIYSNGNIGHLGVILHHHCEPGNRQSSNVALVSHNVLLCKTRCYTYQVLSTGNLYSIPIYVCIANHIGVLELSAEEYCWLEHWQCPVGFHRWLFLYTTNVPSFLQLW